MAKVSIVLPTYNGKKYLEQSIESILAQTYSDWELILIDDCSTDGTYNIVEQYSKFDHRIYAIHNEENKKLPASLNIGFSIAKGKYLTWTSDDNLYMPNALQTMVQYLELHNNIYMVQANMYLIDEKESIIGQLETYSNKEMYLHNCVGACFLYRREVRDKIGDYDINSFCVEDYDYWLRVLEEFEEIAPINKFLYMYRVHKDSLTQIKKEEILNQLFRLRIKHINKILDVLHENQKELCMFYYEMKRSKLLTKKIIDKFKKAIPELCGDMPYVEKNKYIIFGAGYYGEKAAIELGDNAIFFTDNDMSKTGKVKSGLKILSFQDAVKLTSNYYIMIAVSYEKIYEIIIQIWKTGIKQYAVFQI